MCFAIVFMLLVMTAGLDAQSYEVPVDRVYGRLVIVPQPEPQTVIVQGPRHGGLAQDGRYETRAGTVEIGGMGSMTVLANGGGVKPAFAVTSGVSLNRFLSAQGEYSFTSVQNATVFGFSAKSSLMDYGVALLAQVPNGSRVVPYGVMGLGVARGNDRFGILSESLSVFEYNGGVGLRVFLTREVGVRLDLRGYKVHDGLWYARAGVGVFYQFNK